MLEIWPPAEENLTSRRGLRSIQLGEWSFFFLYFHSLMQIYAPWIVPNVAGQPLSAQKSTEMRSLYQRSREMKNFHWKLPNPKKCFKKSFGWFCLSVELHWKGSAPATSFFQAFFSIVWDKYNYFGQMNIRIYLLSQIFGRIKRPQINIQINLPYKIFTNILANEYIFP